MSIPRPEYPNPQFERKDWINLNGKWEFETDKGVSGKDRKIYEKEKLSGEILVPFCPESELSGIGEKDFMNSVWYKRDIEVKESNDLVILHIGACDYYTTLYVNGKVVGSHKGGYTHFSFDITNFVKAGTNTIVINAEDNIKNPFQPCGKQCTDYYSYGAFYTRTTGIWQTVWLEYVPKTHIESVKYYPDSENGKLLIRALVTGDSELCAVASYNGKEVGRASVKNNGQNADLTIELAEKHLWEPGKGRLYDLKLTYGDDEISSYFGLRNIAIDGYRFKLNGKTVFQRTVLDQGFYPDGIYTAPSEDVLVNDIQISLDAGFNGARLHEKVFEPRFLYHCDKMGYMVWGEYANWGLDHTELQALPVFLREWQEAVERDFNHPAIIGWCPFNETWDINDRKQKDEVPEMIYRTTKLMDTTRPCIDTSGNFHVITDIFDFHDYCQDVEDFKGYYDLLEKEDIVMDQTARQEHTKNRQVYQKGQAVFASEYGGIKWDIEHDSHAWGYGNAPKTEEEFIERYRGLTNVLLANSKMMGFCYTQLYDVEQEKNGLYTYSRKPKFDMEIFKEINTQRAKIEE